MVAFETRVRHGVPCGLKIHHLESPAGCQLGTGSIPLVLSLALADLAAPPAGEAALGDSRSGLAHSLEVCENAQISSLSPCTRTGVSPE